MMIMSVVINPFDIYYFHHDEIRRSNGMIWESSLNGVR